MYTDCILACSWRLYGHFICPDGVIKLKIFVGYTNTPTLLN